MSAPERDPLFYWKQNHVPVCRVCGESIAIGATQCAKSSGGRNVRIVDHADVDGRGIVIQAADVDDFLKAVEIARKVRTL